MIKVQIVAETADTVTLRRADYEKLMAAAEDIEVYEADLEAVFVHRASLSGIEPEMARHSFRKAFDLRKAGLEMWREERQRDPNAVYWEDMRYASEETRFWDAAHLLPYTRKEMRRMREGEAPLRILRERRGWSQGKLASAAGMSVGELAALEIVPRQRHGDMLHRLARALPIREPVVCLLP